MPKKYERHGMKHTLVYDVWLTMKQRCLNPKNKHYSYYGGRGIQVCERWKNSFRSFMQDMGPRPHGMTLERVDNNGPYSPENCVWASRLSQCLNRRDTRTITHNGITLHLREWANKIGIEYNTLYSRLNRYRWSVEKALTTPLSPKGRRRTIGGEVRR